MMKEYQILEENMYYFDEKIFIIKAGQTIKCIMIRQKL